jgi:hypothetical protein
MAPVFCLRRRSYVPYTLEQVDLIRERLRVGYAEAKEALDAADGDVIAALASLEASQHAQTSDESFETAISQIAEEVKGLLRGGEIRGIRLRLGDQTVKEVPVALVGVGAALIAFVSAVLAHASVELITSSSDDTDDTQCV